MKINEISPVKGAKKARKRVGRGVASGTGKTAGRGSNGQNCRSGGGVRPGFEGGQMPIHRRLPKRGFTNIFRKNVKAINVKDLARFESGATVDHSAVIASGLVKQKNTQIKLLGQGEIKYPLTIKLNKISKTAKEKIEAAGGSIEVI